MQCIVVERNIDDMVEGNMLAMRYYELCIHTNIVTYGGSVWVVYHINTILW